MSNKSARIEYILKMLSVSGFVEIKELSEKLKVSKMTIHRDLNELSKNDLLKLVPGGAIFQQNESIYSNQDRYLVRKAEKLYTEEKIKICQKAASLINENDIIVIDTGSTTQNISNFIPKDMSLIIICYALNILLGVYGNEKWKVIFPGGYFHDNTLMFESSEGNQIIRRIRANKAFISAAGISDKLGVTCANLYEKETKRSVIDFTETKILLADSSKFGKVKISHFAELKDFNIVITDKGISKEHIEIINSLNIKLHIV